MAFTYDIFYDRWRSCTISYTFGTLPDRIGAFRYISATTSCDSMPQYCCVPGCTNSGGHVFPSDSELKKKWRVAIIKRLDENSKNLYWTPVALFTKILTITNCRKCKTKIKKSFTKILTITLSVKIVLTLRVKLPCPKCKILIVREILVLSFIVIVWYL